VSQKEKGLKEEWTLRFGRNTRGKKENWGYERV